MKKNKKKLIIIITLILIILASYIIYMNISIERNDDNLSEYQDYTPEEEISEEQSRQTKVILYFINSENGNLESEVRLIDANTLIENPYKKLMELLLDGPQSSGLEKIIPDGTVVHDVVLEGSTAVVNTSNEILNYETEENKLKMINSIVNTLSNLKEVSSIRFLVNGEKNENISETYVKSNE